MSNRRSLEQNSRDFVSFKKGEKKRHNGSGSSDQARKRHQDPRGRWAESIRGEKKRENEKKPGCSVGEKLPAGFRIGRHMNRKSGVSLLTGRIKGKNTYSPACKERERTASPGDKHGNTARQGGLIFTGIKWTLRGGKKTIDGESWA